MPSQWLQRVPPAPGAFAGTKFPAMLRAVAASKFPAVPIAPPILLRTSLPSLDIDNMVEKACQHFPAYCSERAFCPGIRSVGLRKPGSAGRLRRDGGRPLRGGGSCHHWGKAPEKMILKMCPLLGDNFGLRLISSSCTAPDEPTVLPGIGRRVQGVGFMV